MRTSVLPEDIRQIREMLDAQPGSSGLLNALAALAQNASDASIISASFEGIDPEPYDAQVRDKIAKLLEDGPDTKLRMLWSDVESQPHTNVVDFEKIETQRKPLQPTHGDQALGFDAIGGLENVKAQMRRKIIKPFLNKGLFKSFRRKAGGGILLFGPPGCGKTMLARALAAECQAQFENITAADVLDPYRGVAEQRIANIFAQARSNRPAVLFFDEIEALAQKRRHSGEDNVNTSVSTLLTEMDGFETNNEGLLLLGATNLPWALDSAFRRPGRFDRSIFVPPTAKDARRFIVQALLKDRPIDAALDTDIVISQSNGFSGADLSALVETAVDIAIEDSESKGDIAPLSTEHFKEAFYEVRPTTGEWLAEARMMIEYNNKDGLYDDLAGFLKAHTR